MKTMSSNRSTPHLRQFAPVKYKKAPQAPRRFKSSYMFFSTQKHKEIRAELSEKGEGEKVSTTEVAKMVSQAWKSLPEDEREKWEVLARQDKARYEMEKSMYTGPWKVPATKRISKDPKAPKRPMSAFLSFSNSKRAYVKNKHTDAKNAEVSRILAQMWKDADQKEKKIFIDEEFALRQQYKVAMTEWKRQSEEEIKSKREERENKAIKAVREGKLPIRNGDNLSRSDSIDSATDSSANQETKYSTKMAKDTFGQSSATSYPPALQSSSDTSRPVQYSFSNTEYSQHSQHQQYPPGSSSAYFNPDRQDPSDPYGSTSGDYRNIYGAAYQAQGGNPSSYDRRYEGYDAYGQPHPYGYAPQSYYPQDYTHSGYPPPEHSSPPNYGGGHAIHPPYYHYDPNHSYHDHENSQPPRG